MAAETFTFNIAKGRVVEYYNRVKANDPANSALILVPLAVGGTQAQGQDFDNLSLVLADANFDEAGASWGRKTLTDSDLAALPAPNDTDNRYDISVPQVTWTTPTAGQNLVQLLICYDDNTTSGDDTNIIPLTAHAVAVTADGNDVILQVGNFLRAS